MEFHCEARSWQLVTAIATTPWQERISNLTYL